jgi:hypothetical protein
MATQCLGAGAQITGHTAQIHKALFWGLPSVRMAVDFPQSL